MPSDLSEDGGAPPAPPPAAAIAVFFFLYGWSAAPRKMRLGQNRPPTGEEGWMSGSRQKRSEGRREQTNKSNAVTEPCRTTARGVDARTSTGTACITTVQHVLFGLT